MRKLRVLDLFSGIGGFSLGLERTGGFETVAFCEIDPFCRKVLAKHWPKVPIYEDVRTLDATGLGSVDCITGGYPCQPFSHAGKRRGAEDDRHLWPAMLAVIKAHRPAWVIGENVAGHISMGLDEVLSDLEAAGYAARTFAVPAVAVDAPHRRMRVWIVAHAECSRRRQQLRADAAREPFSATERSEGPSGFGSGGEVVADTNDVLHAGGLDGRGDTSSSGRGEGGDAEKGKAPNGQRVRTEFSASSEVPADANGSGLPITIRPGLGRVQRQEGSSSRSEPGRRSPEDGRAWLPEPNVGRVAHGVPNRVDRLKSLGNAVVPQIPELIGRAILHSMEAA